MKSTRLLFAVLTILCAVGWCQAADGDPISTETMVIDVPTAEVFDRYQASFLTRVYEHGTVMESIDFGVLSQINVGVSVAVYELVGNSDDIKILNPDFQAKWKIFDGNLYFPAIAIGYDGRRYGYIKPTKDYLDDRKGGYLTMTREIFVPGLEATAGVNLSDFDHHDIYFFLGTSWKPAEWVALLGEWDNINNMRDSRANVGVRFYLTSSLALSGAVRRLGRGDENERIVQLRYVTNF